MIESASNCFLACVSTYYLYLLCSLYYLSAYLHKWTRVTGVSWGINTGSPRDGDESYIGIVNASRQSEPLNDEESSKANCLICYITNSCYSDVEPRICTSTATVDRRSKLPAYPSYGPPKFSLPAFSPQCRVSCEHSRLLTSQNKQI